MNMNIEMNKFIMTECLKSLSVVGLISISSYYIYKQRLAKELYHYPKHTLTLQSDYPHYDDVVRYIYKHNADKITETTYEVSKVYSFRDWRNRRKELPGHMKITRPYECHLFLDHEYQETDYQIEVDISFVKDAKGNPVKLLEETGCGTSEESLLGQVTLSSVNSEVLRNYVDEAVRYVKDEIKQLKKDASDSMNVYYYKKDYWVLLAKSPKRSEDTIYLREGQKEDIVGKVEEFFSDETRDVYLSFGIPYKSVFMIHGPPGSGKTSTIKAIASSLDCDLYVLPITKDMLDTHLVEAFTYINEQEEKERIIVIEDVDTMFDERKEGDNKNGITLQGFLNCMDGFTCVEGTMLFITANKPEVLDYAMVRSCRIDQKFELGYADEYQTKQMFEKFFPEQLEDFESFYDDIKHKKYTTAMLQELFFYNRKSEKIIDKLELFSDIVSKNDPKNYELLKDVDKNFYM
jgi:SpoVK/Ycf46/Vps4 family AAA+-type ATPase